MATIGIDIAMRDRIQKSIQTQIDAIGRSALASDRHVKSLQVSVNSLGVATVTGRLAPGLVRTGQAADRASRSVKTYAASARTAAVANRNLYNSTLETFRGLRTIASIAAVIGAGRGFVGALDTYQQLENRLKSITDGHEQLGAVMRKLFNIANETRTPVLGLATAYQRYDKALSRAGASQQEVLDFTTTIAKALKIAGATATETESVMLQLGQALTKGNLDGEELRALRENAPIEVMEALANVLGVNVGQLKELGRQGLITTSVMRQAFRDLKITVDRDFAQTLPTVSEAFVVLGNKLTQFFGENERVRASMKALAAGIINAANNVPDLIRKLQGLGAAMLVMKLQSGALKISLVGLITAFRTLAIVTGAALVGGLVAYRNELKVTEDEMVTFADAIKTHWTLLKKFLEDITIETPAEDLFSSDTASEFFRASVELVKKFTVAMTIGFNKVSKVFGSAFVEVVQGMQILWLKFVNNVRIGADELVTSFQIVRNSVRELFGGESTPVTGLIGTAFAVDTTKAEIGRLERNLEIFRKKTKQSAKEAAEEINFEFDLAFKLLEGQYRATADARVAAEEAAAEKILKANQTLRLKNRQKEIEDEQFRRERFIQASNERIQDAIGKNKTLVEVVRAGIVEEDRINQISNQKRREYERETSRVLKEEWNAVATYIEERTRQMVEVVRSLLTQISNAISGILSSLGSILSQNGLPLSAALLGPGGPSFLSKLGGTGVAAQGSAFAGSLLNAGSAGLQGIQNYFSPITNIVSDAFTSGIQQAIRSPQLETLGPELQQTLERSINKDDLAGSFRAAQVSILPPETAQGIRDAQLGIDNLSSSLQGMYNLSRSNGPAIENAVCGPGG